MQGQTFISSRYNSKDKISKNQSLDYMKI